jgi:hypothetical protein
MPPFVLGYFSEGTKKDALVGAVCNIYQQTTALSSGAVLTLGLMSILHL